MVFAVSVIPLVSCGDGDITDSGITDTDKPDDKKMSLEEIEGIYTEYTENIDVYFEYDFERLFSDREYFEELIETAEYPVFVDEALRK